MSRRIWGPFSVLVAITLAGCGASAPSGARTGTRSTAARPASVDPGGPRRASTTTTNPTTTTASGAFASLAPATIFSDALQALGGARSFTAAGTESRSGHRTDVRLTYAQPSHVEAHIRAGAARAAIIATPFAAYIDANVVFAQRHFGGLPADEAKDLANRWLELDGRVGASESRPLLRFTPRQLSACLSASFPSPTLGGTTTRDGRAVVLLRSTSRSTGSANLFVELAPPHYPVLFQRLDARSVNNARDPCEQSAGGIGQVHFADWNRATVTLPMHTTILP